MGNTSSLRKWSNDYTYSTNVEVHTRMYDMGDITTIKEIYSVKITLGGSISSNVPITLYYRTNTAGSWSLFGTGSAIPTQSKLINITPLPLTSNPDIIETVTINEDNTTSTYRKLTNIYVIQFKISAAWASTAGQLDGASIDDFSVEYRKRRSKNIEGPQV